MQLEEIKKRKLFNDFVDELETINSPLVKAPARERIHFSDLIRIDYLFAFLSIALVIIIGLQAWFGI